MSSSRYNLVLLSRNLIRTRRDTIYLIVGLVYITAGRLTLVRGKWSAARTCYDDVINVMLDKKPLLIINVMKYIIVVHAVSVNRFVHIKRTKENINDTKHNTGKARPLSHSPPTHIHTQKRVRTVRLILLFPEHFTYHRIKTH